MRNKLLILLMVLLPMGAMAQQMTITTDSVGQLAQQLPDSIRYTMQELKICGPINGNDLKVIQLITSRLKPKKPTDQVLSAISCPRNLLLCMATTISEASSMLSRKLIPPSRGMAVL